MKHLALFLSLFLCGCGGSGSGDHGHGHDHDHDHGPVVEWPAVQQLHDLQMEAHDFLHENKNAEAGAKMQEFMTALSALNADSIPETVKNRAAVEVLVTQDLAGLAQAGFDPEAASPEQLGDFIHAMHAIVAKLMDTSGMPHRHDHDH